MATPNLISIIKSDLEKQSDPIKAPAMEAYMKNLFSYYGISSPVRKKVVSAIWKKHKDEIRFDLTRLVKALWEEDKRELQYVAMDLLSKCQKQLKTDDIKTMEYLIINKSWWDTVDFLATNPVGSILENNRDLQYQKSKEYINSENMWLQRTALLFQLKYKDSVNQELLYSNICSLLGSKEFFINKAIGWALRQYSKYNPNSVKQFIDDNCTRMAGLSIREGSKYLN